MDGPELPWSERATYVVSADRGRRVLETWFNARVLLPPAATFSQATGSPGGHAPIAEAPTFSHIATRRLRIIADSLRKLPSAMREGHFLPVLPVLLGIAGITAAITRPSRRRALVFLAFMGLVTLAPLLSHIEARFLYAPFALGLVAATGGWAWIAARLLAIGDSNRGDARGLVIASGAWIVLAAGVAMSGVRHTDGIVEPIAREALHRSLAKDVARLAGGRPVLAVQSNLPFWSGCPYRPIPVGSPHVVLDYARAQGASCLVLEGTRDLRRRPELEPLLSDPPPPGYRLELLRPAPQGGELRVFRIEPASGQHGAGGAALGGVDAGRSVSRSATQKDALEDGTNGSKIAGIRSKAEMASEDMESTLKNVPVAAAELDAAGRAILCRRNLVQKREVASVTEFLTP